MQEQKNNRISMEEAGQDALISQRGMNQNPYINNAQNENNENLVNPQDSLLNSFDSANFIKGALLGAVGAYLLTNENAQKTIFKGLAKTASMFQVGMEEMKERFEDAQAEIEADKTT